MRTGTSSGSSSRGSWAAARAPSCGASPRCCAAGARRRGLSADRFLLRRSIRTFLALLSSGARGGARRPERHLGDLRGNVALALLSRPGAHARPPRRADARTSPEGHRGVQARLSAPPVRAEDRGREPHGLPRARPRGVPIDPPTRDRGEARGRGRDRLTSGGGRRIAGDGHRPDALLRYGAQPPGAYAVHGAAERAAPHGQARRALLSDGEAQHRLRSRRADVRARLRRASGVHHPAHRDAQAGFALR